jgi:hypothetical protein
LIKWRSEFASGFKIFLTLLLLSSFFIHASAQSCNSFGIDFTQGANKDNFTDQGHTYVLGEIHWIGSILQNSNSRYVEGMSTLQRVVFNNLPSCGQGFHKLRIRMEAEKNELRHAYDFITSWDNALLAAAQIAPGLGLMPTSRSDPKLHECGPNISACAANACNLVTGGGIFRDLPVIFSDFANSNGPGETNFAISQPIADQNTTRQVIQTYQCRYGPRTVRLYVGAAGFGGTNGDANNRVEFIGYGSSAPHVGDSTYIWYDVSWVSTSPDVVLEYGAHIAVGIDGLALSNPGGCNVTGLGVGYLIGHGASDINGGPYHTIIEDFQNTTNNNPKCEPNLGNLDNQLQGSEILLIPFCNITGGSSSVCVGSGNLTFNAHPLNLDAATFQWTIIHNETGASIVGSSTDSIVVVAPGNTPGCDTLQFIVTNPGGPFSDTCKVAFCVTCPTPTIGAAGANATIECTATPSFTAPTASDACGGATVNLLGTTTSTTGCTKVLTRTWDATNSCGNHSATRTQVITIVDTQAPTIGSAGGNATIECTATPTFSPPTASDACNGATVNNLGTTTSTTGCTKVLTRTWDATDACGNHSATRTQVITVVDTQPPTIGDAGGNATIQCTGTPNFTAPTASDACNGATVNNLGTTTSTTGGATCTVVLTRTWDATDACGNHSATRTQVITVVDTTPPTIGDAGGNATIECTATPSFTAPTASDLCSGATVNNLGTTTSTTGCTSVITRRWDATDACGNHSATRTQVITVVDTTPPTIGSAGGNATIECTATPSFTAPTASDACNGATVNNLGTTTSTTGCTTVLTRRWDATDACGNHSVTRTQVITVTDTTPPTIGEAGGNATIECTATPSFSAPTASDACNGATVNNLGTTTSTTGCTSVITRRWDATDACGNHSVTRTQVITVVDTTPPTIGQAGGNATIECTATPSFSAPTASDACNGATVNNLGTTTSTTGCTTVLTRRWDATDACGNHSVTRTQVITVTDTQPPTIGQAGGNATIECTATPNFSAPTASDACSGATVNNLGTTTSTTGCTKVLTRTWDATDACGNHSATRSQIITIVDTQGPTIGGQGANATLDCTGTPSFTPPTASDACNGATVNQLSSGTTSTPSSTTITRRWDATDACGNHSATVSQTITINTCPTTFCGFTQGFYGNKNGLAAMRDSGLLLSPIIIGSTLPGKNSVLIPAGDPSAVKVNQVMPGQSTPGPLTVSGQCNILDACFDSYLNNKGKISNVLLGQTIALSLNVRLHNTLLGLPAIPAGQCFIIEGDTLNINQNVINYLICTSGSATVAKILQLANDLLGGVLVPGQQVSGCTVPSYGDITEAVDFLNTSFDECKDFTGFGSCVPLVITARAIVPQESGGLKVTAYPNPFSSVVKFTIQSNVSGDAQLEVYNQLGQKVSTIYRGYLQANRNQVVEYKAPRLGNQLIYILRVGGHSVSGKLLRLE